jgi:hypothetical protein
VFAPRLASSLAGSVAGLERHSFAALSSPLAVLPSPCDRQGSLSASSKRGRAVPLNTRKPTFPITADIDEAPAFVLLVNAALPESSQMWTFEHSSPMSQKCH